MDDDYGIRVYEEPDKYARVGPRSTSSRRRQQHRKQSACRSFLVATVNIFVYLLLVFAAILMTLGVSGDSWSCGAVTDSTEYQCNLAPIQLVQGHVAQPVLEELRRGCRFFQDTSRERAVTAFCFRLSYAQWSSAGQLLRGAMVLLAAGVACTWLVTLLTLLAFLCGSCSCKAVDASCAKCIGFVAAFGATFAGLMTYLADCGRWEPQTHLADVRRICNLASRKEHLAYCERITRSDLQNLPQISSYFYTPDNYETLRIAHDFVYVLIGTLCLLFLIGVTVIQWRFCRRDDT